jgi:hypothetical protein
LFNPRRANARESEATVPKTALLVRSYTPNDGEVADRAERALKVAQAASTFDSIALVAFLVPTDHDCGKTAQAIRNRLYDAGANNKTIVIEAGGHHSCGALNEALRDLNAKYVERVVIMSGKAQGYLTGATLGGIDEAFVKGAKIVGVAVDEHVELVHEGRVSNTFCAWDLNALLDVGGFDSDVGVEEIAAALKIVHANEHKGPCIAVLDAPGVLDVLKVASAKARHAEVMATKTSRQQSEAARLGYNLKFLKTGIMPGYPKAV